MRTKHQKYTIIAFFVAIVLSFLACISYYIVQTYPFKIEIENEILQKKDEVNYKINYFGPDTSEVEFSILDPNDGENLMIRYQGNGHKYLHIVAYCFIEGKKIEVFDNGFILKDNSTGVYYEIPTKQMHIEGLTAEDGIDHSNSGLDALCNMRFLSKDRKYSLYIYYRSDGENILVNTGEVLYVE